MNNRTLRLFGLCLMMAALTLGCSDRTTNFEDDQDTGAADSNAVDTGGEDTGEGDTSVEEDTTAGDTSTEEDSSDTTAEDTSGGDTAEADVSDPDATDTTEADVSDPDAQDTTDPDVAQDTTDPDVAQDTTDPDVAQDTTDPDVAQDTTDPDAADGETTQPPAGEAPAEGELLIVELMGNPNTLLDEDAEYIELLNVSAKSLELQGMTVAFADWAGGEPDRSFGLWVVPESFVVEPGVRVLLVRSADAGLNGGLTPDLVYSGNATELSNSDKRSVRVRLYGAAWDGNDPAAELIDEVKAGPAIITNETRGLAWQLNMATPTAVGNDDPTNWCLTTADATLEYSTGNYGTPGADNACEP